MEKSDVIEQRVWNTKQLAWIVGVAIAVTFSATMIWGRFLFMEAKITTLEDRIEKKDDRVNDKVDKNAKDIELLKMPNSDNE